MTFYSNPKRNYVLNPRGKALYDDASRFGTKMLEKMGWTKGKGLGANLDGQLEFIKVSHKGDQKGVGFKDRDDQWTTHESNFNSLLSSFQSAENSDEESQDCAVQHFQTDNKPAKRKKENVYEKEELFSGVSLEEQSKNSRARVHYKKFTRGKDLARYSEKDLANIFGKKTLNGNVNGEGSSGESNEDEKLDKSPENVPNFGITTIATGTTINDYFKNKMKKVANGFTDTSVQQVSNGESVSCSKKEKKTKKNADDLTETMVEQATNVESVSSKKKEKKKRKKSKSLDDSKSGDNSPIASEEIAAAVVVVTVDPEQPSINGSKKRKHDSENTEETKSKKKKKSTDDSVVESLGEEAEALPASKKKKKNKSEKVDDFAKDEEDLKTEKPRKSKAKIENDCATVSESPKSSKEDNGYDVNESLSRKKIKSKMENIAASETNSNDLLNESAASHKKSKRKRENKQNEDSSNDTPATPAVQQPTQSTNLFEVIANVADDQCAPEVVTNNVYEIRRYRTEIFRYVDLHGFSGSTLCDIPGYGYTSEMSLKIVEKPDDNKLINTLWNDAQDKYAESNGKKKKKKFVEHIVDLKKKNVFKI